MIEEDLHNRQKWRNLSAVLTLDFRDEAESEIRSNLK